MEKRELKNGNGYVQFDDLKDLKKLLFLKDEATVLGLDIDYIAATTYYTPAFREITKTIEECYADTASCKSYTYKLDNMYSVILQVLPATDGFDKGLAMSLINKNHKEIYKLVKYISIPESSSQDLAPNFVEEFMINWITNLSRDVTHSSLFWLYDQDDDTIRDLMEGD
jgi:hypothetical protein